jgi:hypothetical protein
MSLPCHTGAGKGEQPYRVHQRRARATPLCPIAAIFVVGTVVEAVGVLGVGAAMLAAGTSLSTGDCGGELRGLSIAMVRGQLNGSGM